MFLVFNKEKICAYIVSVVTVCCLFFIASKNQDDIEETSINADSFSNNSINTIIYANNIVK